MKYTIDELTPLNGVTRAQAFETGEYNLWQVWQSDDLEATLYKFKQLVRENGNRSDYELRSGTEERLIETINGIFVSG